MTDRPNGLTYAAAGVDIDAGGALVDAIKPLAKATSLCCSSTTTPPASSMCRRRGGSWLASPKAAS
jgi:hypothetical protein